MKGLVTIDPAKITEKIGRLQAEIRQLHSLLDQLESLSEFAVERPEGAGRGRPVVDNPLVDSLRHFVLRQQEDFSHKELKEALGNPERRDHVRSAIEALEEEGVLEVVRKPMGRNPGLYRKKLNGEV